MCSNYCSSCLLVGMPSALIGGRVDGAAGATNPAETAASDGDCTRTSDVVTLEEASHIVESVLALMADMSGVGTRVKHDVCTDADNVQRRRDDGETGSEGGTGKRRKMGQSAGASGEGRHRVSGGAGIRLCQAAMHGWRALFLNEEAGSRACAAALQGLGGGGYVGGGKGLLLSGCEVGSRQCPLIHPVFLMPVLSSKRSRSNCADACVLACLRACVS